MDGDDSKVDAGLSVSWNKTETRDKISIINCRNLKKMRPASNWGTQYRTLVVNAPGDKSKLLRQDLEIVYPGAGL